MLKRPMLISGILLGLFGVIGSALVTFYGLSALGGWAELKATIGSDMFNLWKPLVPEGVSATWAPIKTSEQMAWYFNDNYPWVGMLFCAPIIGLWYWCADQTIVQRVLGVEDRGPPHVKTGKVLGEVEIQLDQLGNRDL